MILAAGLIAYASTRAKSLLAFFGVFVLSCALLGFGYIVVQRLLDRLRSADKAAVALEAYDSHILALPVDEARSLGERLLSDPSKFRAIPAENADVRLSALPEELRKLLTKYQRVETADGELYVSRESIGPSRLPGFVRVGRGTDLTDLVVKPGSEKIYATSGSEDTERELYSYPTIYHWMLLVGGE